MRKCVGVSGSSNLHWHVWNRSLVEYRFNFSDCHLRHLFVVWIMHSNMPPTRAASTVSPCRDESILAKAPQIKACPSPLYSGWKSSLNRIIGKRTPRRIFMTRLMSFLLMDDLACCWWSVSVQEQLINQYQRQHTTIIMCSRRHGKPSSRVHLTQ